MVKLISMDLNILTRIGVNIKPIYPQFIIHDADRIEEFLFIHNEVSG